MATLTLETPQATIRVGDSVRLDFRRLHAIKTEEEYENAVTLIHALFDLGERRTEDQDDLLEFLSVLVEAYEEANVAMPADASPQEIVSFMLDQHGMTRGDLAEILGGKSKVSEFFSNKRPLSKAQMLAVRERFGIPVDVLIG